MWPFYFDERAKETWVEKGLCLQQTVWKQLYIYRNTLKPFDLNLIFYVQNNIYLDVYLDVKHEAMNVLEETGNIWNLVVVK